MRGRVVLVVLMLVMATLACSLSRGDDDDDKTPTATPRVPGAGPAGTEEVTDGGGNGGGAEDDVDKPTVRFLDPLPPVEISVNEEISVAVEAEHADGVTRLDLFYVQDGGDRQLVDSKSVPSNPVAEAQWPWSPDTPGTYELLVIAHQGRSNPSEPLSYNIEVLDEPTPVAAPTATDPGPCIGTVKETVIRRAGPGTNFNRLGTFGPNQQLDATLRDNDNTGQGWFQVIGPNGEEGWVIGDTTYVDWQGGCNDVPMRVVP